MFKSDCSLISWNVVQLLRGVIIVVLKTFLINPIYRLLLFILLFALFLLHDRSVMPFKSNSLNLLQILSSISLLSISLCNLVSAFSCMVDITGVPYMNITVDVLGYIEKILFFALIPVWLLLWEVWKKFEKKKRKKKQAWLLLFIIIDNVTKPRHYL